MTVARKKCTKCKKTRKAADFSKHAGRKSGLASHCKACCAAKRKAASKDPLARARKMLNNANQRSKKRGFRPPEITVDDILDRLLFSGCDITREPFYIGTSKNGRADPYAPSLHRKNPRKGYTRENTMVILWHINCAISQYEYKDFVFIAQRALEGEGFKVSKPRRKTSSGRAKYKCHRTDNFAFIDPLTAMAA